MLVFLDTEFASFEDPRLISVGLISQTGEECYVELAPSVDGWEPQRTSAFVRQVVLPLLDGAPLPRAAARTAVIDFLRLLTCSGTRPTVITDFTGDWVLLKELIDPLPEDLAGLEAKLYASPTVEHYPFGTQRHHALVDARALRWAFARDFQDA